MVKAKAMCGGTRDTSYNPKSFRAPENIDDAYFPGMKRGTVITDDGLASKIIADLLDLPRLTRPCLTDDVWKVCLMSESEN